jgi:Winged helix DNA-binding domain
MTTGRRVSARELNRATLQRQWLQERHRATPSEAVGALAGLQAQHANWPYVALWSRVRDLAIPDLEAALKDRSVVKGTLMRGTLHVVAADHYFVFNGAVGESRTAVWESIARRAGLDLDVLHEELLAFCDEPRTVAEMEAHLDKIAPDSKVGKHFPTGVRHVAFRLASAGGGLVHVPPSGLWRSHGKPAYIDARAWLNRRPRLDARDALEQAVERYLAGYGPASPADIKKWLGQPQLMEVRAAIEALGDRIVPLTGPDGRELLDLADAPRIAGDAKAPVRFLARWDSVLISYDVRDRILPDAHRDAVIKKNGDILPTILVDGLVAGLWAAVAKKGEAVLTISPFGKVPAAARRDLEAEAERLVRFVEPEASRYGVAWEAAG